MLIKYEKDGDLYKCVCTCGETFYTYKIDPKIRCLSCLKVNNKVNYDWEEEKRLRKIIYSLCKKEYTGF
jgi:hypothetical protein